MIGLVLNVIVILVPLVIYLATGINSAGSETGFAISAIIAGGWTIVNVILHGCIGYDQISNIEKIEEHVGRRIIFAEQRDELITQAVLYLGQTYPEHEKELFKMISEKNSEAVVNILTALPEIKSADTLKELVNTLRSLHGNVYSEDLKIEGLKRRIRIRSRNPWLLQCIIPKYEETKKKYNEQEQGVQSQKASR